VQTPIGRGSRKSECIAIEKILHRFSVSGVMLVATRRRQKRLDSTHAKLQDFGKANSPRASGHMSLNGDLSLPLSTPTFSLMTWKSISLPPKAYAYMSLRTSRGSLQKKGDSRLGRHIRQCCRNGTSPSRKATRRKTRFPGHGSFFAPLLLFSPSSFEPVEQNGMAERTEHVDKISTKDAQNGMRFI
jgi:hypothetical protein